MIRAEITISTCYGDATIPVEILGKGYRPHTRRVRALIGEPFILNSVGGPYTVSTTIVNVLRLQNVRLEEVGVSAYRQYLDAQHKRVTAFAKFQAVENELIAKGLPNNSAFYAAKQEYDQATREFDEAEERYQDEQAIPVVMPGYVKENADNFSSK